MSERKQRMYAESVSSATVTLEAVLNDPPGQGGIGIIQVVVTTFESTAQAGFWGTTGSCGVYDVIIRKVD